MSQPPLPSVAPFAQRLAENNRRVGRALDQLPTLFHAILAAWDRRDQRSLHALSEHLVSLASGQPTLAAASAEILRHVETRQRLPLQRSLLALAGEVGALRSRGMVPATVLPAAGQA